MTTLTYRKVNKNYNLFLNIDGRVRMSTINANDSNYDAVVSVLDEIFETDEYLENNTVTPELLKRLLNTISKPTAAEEFIQAFEPKDGNKENRLKIEDGHISFDGVYLSGMLIDRILDYQKRGVREVRSLIRFLERLMENPSFRVHEQLFKFLERGQTAITGDGHFLAYKYINADFTSVHDGKTLHKIGTYVEMPRHMVDDNPNNTCSHGLHVCSNEYLGGYSQGRKVLQIKVDPKDVVSVPTDYNATKMRVCRYFVEGELTKEQVESDYLAQEPVRYNDEEAEEYGVEDDSPLKRDTNTKYDSLGRPIPPRGPDGKFLKKAA